MTRWDDRYRSGEHVSFDPLPLLVDWESRLAETAGGRGRALDLASGTGGNALFLAEQGWRVTAVDSSAVAQQILQQEAERRRVLVETVRQDLESDECRLPGSDYELILDCFFLHKPLFSAIRAALIDRGMFFGAWPIHDEEVGIRPMNPRYLAAPPEIVTEFDGWEILHCIEHKPGPMKRKRFELIAQRKVFPQSH